MCMLYSPQVVPYTVPCCSGSLAAGANPLVQDSDRETPLHKSAAQVSDVGTACQSCSPQQAGAKPVLPIRNYAWDSFGVHAGARGCVQGAALIRATGSRHEGQEGPDTPGAGADPGVCTCTGRHLSAIHHMTPNQDAQDSTCSAGQMLWRRSWHSTIIIFE
jgi:hypothetical protein